ncbi:hypothetical protein J6590_069588 [Homalodisca vitripennis]|nr:hypothetical protein J6590_069588 [Homalodisca vitripennis]
MQNAGKQGIQLQLARARTDTRVSCERATIVGDDWIADTEGDCALILLNRRKATLQSETGQDIVWLELKNIWIFSCYFTPNKPLEEIAQALDELVDVVRESRKGAIIAGDFNAKSTKVGIAQRCSWTACGRMGG